jgi:hypothetical protein
MDRYTAGTALATDRLGGSQAFRWVTVYGRTDPTVVAREWSYKDLMDHYYRLRIKDQIEA